MARSMAQVTQEVESKKFRELLRLKSLARSPFMQAHDRVEAERKKGAKLYGKRKDYFG